jgi:hypothetical protein
MKFCSVYIERQISERLFRYGCAEEPLVKRGEERYAAIICGTGSSKAASAR